MPLITDPFGDGFSVAEMTAAIDRAKVPPLPLRRLGLFRERPVRTTSVLVEEREGSLAVLPSRPRGAPATVAERTRRTVRSFAIPHFPHDDVVLPEDLQDGRVFGATGLVMRPDVVAQKSVDLRARHDLTREYVELNALFGTVKDGEGTVLYDYFAEFGLTQIVVDFDLGTSTTDVKAKCAEVIRAIQDEAVGYAYTEVVALVSSEFMDKLLDHPSVKELFTGWGGAATLRDDPRAGFAFGGIRFQEYRVTFPKPNGAASERLIAPNDGVAFPADAVGLFETYFAPPNVIDMVNEPGVPVYVQAIPRPDRSGVDIRTESNFLPLVTRPSACIKLTTTT